MNDANRSETFRDLIRRELVRREWAEGEDVAGAVTIIYDPHRSVMRRHLFHPGPD